MNDENLVFQADATAAISELRAELIEQARIVGMGAERELALMAKISELRAEMQKQAFRSFTSEGEWIELTEELSVEVKRLRVDAERYRLLRRGRRWSVVDGVGDLLRADTLDAAIDAARSAASGESAEDGV